jgi:hypothetical protein
VLPDGGVGKVGQNTDAVGAQIFCEHLDVIVDVAIGGDFHVGKNYVVDSQNAFVHFLRQDWVHALIQTF